MRGDYGTSQDKPVKTTDGRTVNGEREKINRWKEYFETVLNRPVPLQTLDISESEEDIDISTDPITVEEVKHAIKKLKSGKAPGEDEICAEMLKAGGEETARHLCQILQNIWETEQPPKVWKTGLVIKLPKKGDLSSCGNWRGITLLFLTSKVFCRILLNRISEAVDENIRNAQAGFRKGRSCHKFLSSPHNGTTSSTSYMLTLRKLSTACNVKHYGISLEVMVSL